jgi:hypothetical protein
MRIAIRCWQFQLIFAREDVNIATYFAAIPSNLAAVSAERRDFPLCSVE